MVCGDVYRVLHGIASVTGTWLVTKRLQCTDRLIEEDFAFPYTIRGRGEMSLESISLYIA